MAKPMRSYLRRGFHVAWDKSYRSKKPFFRNGKKRTIRSFQDALKAQKSKLEISLSLIGNERYGLREIILLKRGRPLLETVLNPEKRNELANTLYEAAIDPRFFSEALHLIAAKAVVLKPLLKEVRLRNLRRDNIAHAIRQQKMDVADIGENFQLFSTQPVSKRLEILKRLGVLVLKRGASLTQQSPAAESRVPFLRETAPRPSIKRVVPGRRGKTTERQLDFFD
jgi:hypothetical protein